MNKKIKNSLKKISPAILLIAVIIIGLIGGGTLAYITREGRTENVITAGDIKVKLYNMLDENTEMPQRGIYGVLANVSYPNIVYAKNECDYPEYIRMKISKDVVDKDGTELDATKISPNFNTDDWTYREEDGYWYYNHILEPQTKSKPLYESIYFDKTINNAYKTATLNMHIVVEAVQSDNNGNNIYEATGWEVKALS